MLRPRSFPAAFVPRPALEACGLPAVPLPGRLRLIAVSPSEPCGAEVWTGQAWLPLADLRFVGSIYPPGAPVLHTVSLIAERVMPADLGRWG